MGHKGWRRVLLGGALVSIAAAALACGGGASQADLTAAEKQLKEKETQLAAAQSELTAAKGQLTAAQSEAATAKKDLASKDQALQVVQKQLAGMAPTTIVQTGQLQSAPAGAQPTGWDTPESIKGGVKLLATYDSSGPDAWDRKAHSTVYFTTEGQGYGHRPSKGSKLPGVQVIDGYSKQVVASALFDLGLKEHGTPHGLGVSPDGKWVYIATGEGAHAMTAAPGTVRMLVINARTLKLDKVLDTGTGRHHFIGFKDWQGRDRILTGNNWGNTLILDPNNDHKVVKAFTPQDLPSTNLAFGSISGQGFGHPYLTVDPTGKYLYQPISPYRGAFGETATAGLAKVDLETGKATFIWGLGEKGNPIGVAHTADGKFTYVNDGHGSHTYKIDNATNEIVGETSAGVAGPYGLALNWDETELYAVGKGEGSHNTGGVVGLIDTKIFRPTQAINQPINIGGSILDHAILHPDPAVNELWFSSAGTWETIVLDLNTKTVKARIPSPNGGDTHSGAFVRYSGDGTGELLIDMGGPQKAMYAIKKDKAAKAAGKAQAAP